MTYLQRYLMQYRNGCAILQQEFRKYQALPLTKESIDDHIKAFDLIIQTLQNTRRSLYFFKNVLDSGRVVAPQIATKPSDDPGPGAA
jgi:hypothetical protein